MKGSKLKKLEVPKLLVDQTYEMILDALCDGTFKPGDRLTQEEIAARLNVSRQPVTHALAVLKAQGFLTQSGRRGLTVTSHELEFFEAIYQFRAAVESLAVSLATPRLTDQAIREGRALVERGRKLALAGDRRASLQADADFHAFIYRLSGNPIIEETMNLHWRHIHRAMGRVLAYPGVPESVWDEHSEIFEKMVSGNVNGAAEQMRQHLIDAYQRVSISGSNGNQAQEQHLQ